MMGFALVGLAFGTAYAWVNLGRRLHPIGMAEVFWGGEPIIRDDGTYSDVSNRRLSDGRYLLLYRADDGEILHGGTFKTRRAAKAWRPMDGHHSNQIPTHCCVCDEHISECAGHPLGDVIDAAQGNAQRRSHDD